MRSIASATMTQPLVELEPGAVLIAEGSQSGKLYLLVSGKLSVERDGVVIATVEEPGSFVGEMALLLGTQHSATVKARERATIRVIENALDFLHTHPELALHVATIACARLNETSALLVELRRVSQGKKSTHTLLQRLAQTLVTTPKRRAQPGVRTGWAEHE